MNQTELQNQILLVMKSLNSVLLGKEQQVKLAVTCMLANGHLLIEDLPGMGKTTLSHALADVFGLNYQRSQFTSDMLPADVLGVSIFDQSKQAFSFHKGPIFSQLLLADEINRANPKTQSALLEAMEEQQVSIDGTTYTLPRPHFVIATQNPVHQSGTYPLPESQLDRFLMRLQLGYPPASAELQLLLGQKHSQQTLPTLLDPEQLIKAQDAIFSVQKSEAIVKYVLRLLEHSREPAQFPNPLSPRAGLALIKSAQAYAFIHNKDYVDADDIKAVFPSVAEHRLRGGHATGLSTNFSDAILSAVPVFE
jgi:MoxR-like ATPase